MSKNIAYGLGILLVALMLYLGLITNSQQENVAGLSAGKKAPDFTLKTLDGKEVSLKDYRGKVVLLNFWATWCPPCREEMPLFVRMYEKYKDKGFEILAVSTDSSLEPVKKFVKEYRINFPVLYDDKNVVSLYGIQGLPTSFLIDRDGVILKVRLGEYKEIEKDLKEVL
ncbi:TlpA disulfide reductase family protein [Hydrogenivirga sp. 128-5-R1-1]|uniref:peroxiredoxin family protein n=1 Tax=Hydrogenivirga sp. 128-5-R1-1 TaxID=392423 RepID=UPI00015EF824|nr:TlpA disulfide reductase family protein [Hydrogenivirga sp. 128-5-R1-1]EDP75663.1 alkyl hydroperoxide reductase [Hydrogenivirga sp. 128-5-R1-1]